MLEGWGGWVHRLEGGLRLEGRGSQAGRWEGHRLEDGVTGWKGGGSQAGSLFKFRSKDANIIYIGGGNLTYFNWWG